MEDIINETLFEKYVVDCRTLKDELDCAIKDLEFVDQGGKLYFAVDFSEIHAYAKPVRPKRRFFLFPDEPLPGANEPDLRWMVREEQLRHLYVLDRLFYTEDSPLVLLAPYAAELHSFLRNHQQTLVQNAMQWIQAYGEYTSSTNTLQDAKTISRFIEGDGSSSSQQNVATTDYINSFRHRFIQLKKASDQEQLVSARLRGLSVRGAFVNLEEIVGQTFVQVDSSDHKRRFDALVSGRTFHSKRRPEAIEYAFEGADSDNDDYERTEPLYRACEFDALAVDMIQWATQALKDENKRVLLVTRSYIMNDILSSEGELWENGPPVRHPRLFNRYGVHPSSDQPGLRKDLIRELYERRASVSRFLETYSEYERLKNHAMPNAKVGAHAASSTDELAAMRRSLDNEIMEIKNTWRSTEYIPMSESYEALPDWDSQEGDNNFGFVDDILDNEHTFVSFVAKLHSVRTEWIDRELDALVLSLPPSVKGEMRPLETLFHQAPNNMLHTSLQAQPYPLFLQSQQAQHYLSELQNYPRRQSQILDYLLNRLIPNLERRDERWLIIAYIQGLQNEWNLAFRFCNLALHEPPTRNDGLLLEILLLTAVCNRKRLVAKAENRFTRYATSLDYLREALNLSQRDRKLGDPRLIKEMATQVIQAHLELLTSGTFQEDFQIEFPSRGRAFQWLNEAEALCVNNDLIYLKIQIQNNRLTFRIEEAIWTRTYTKEICQQIEAEYEALLFHLNGQSHDPKDWSCLFYDTILWTEWNLFGSAKQNILDVYRTLLERARQELATDELRQLVAHADRVKKRERPLMEGAKT